MTPTGILRTRREIAICLLGASDNRICILLCSSATPAAKFRFVL